MSIRLCPVFFKNVTYLLTILSSIQVALAFFLSNGIKHTQQRRPMFGLGCSTKKWKAIPLVPTYNVGRYKLTMNEERNFTLRCEPSEISGPKHSCVKIYKRRCLILRATKRTEWLMSCVQQTGTQSESVFVTCCHLSSNCSTTHHIVATDEYLKEGETVRITVVDLYLCRGVQSHRACVETQIWLWDPFKCTNGRTIKDSLICSRT